MHLHLSASRLPMDLSPTLCTYICIHYFLPDGGRGLLHLLNGDCSYASSYLIHNRIFSIISFCYSSRWMWMFERSCWWWWINRGRFWQFSLIFFFFKVV